MRTKPGLYVHVPFCLKKCGYCDFYSLPRGEWDTDAYESAVLRNVARYGGTCFDTIYFGGGTPCVAPGLIERVLAAVSRVNGAEITVECNPEALDPSSLGLLREAGVNRLSFGVQSMEDGELSALGRLHNAKRAEEMITLASKSGFGNISADIMLGIPRQTKGSLSMTIERLCALPITNISAYMLKIEENTPFGRNPPTLPNEDEQAELYLFAVEQLERRGFLQYEISNFAKMGFESRHNLKYWRREEYVGIGASAHSFYGGKRYCVPRDIRAFIAGDAQPEELTDPAPDEYEERVMLGLRLREGIARELWQPLSAALERIPKDYCEIKDGRLALTKRGFLLSNEIIAILLNERK